VSPARAGSPPARERSHRDLAATRPRGRRLFAARDRFWGPGTKGAEESGVLAIRGSQPLRKSEYWQWMTPFVCQTSRFPGFQRARIANTRHSSATLGSRGLPIARGPGFRGGNPGLAAYLAAGGPGECSREASTAKGLEPPLSMNSSPSMACRPAADRVTLPFFDF
jgi:hypothetical protein